MKRRHFLKQIGALTGAATLHIGGMPVRAFSKPFFNLPMDSDKILVIVQLSGGNDGHNTVVPIENSIYYNKRPTLNIPKSEALELDELTGLHPRLGSFKEFYDRNMLAIIQNVGYKDQIRSHFRSTDIWLSGSNPDNYLQDGWVGRYLMQAFPGFPDIAPPEPMAIQLGSVQSLLFEGEHGGTGVTINNPNKFHQLVQGSEADNDPPPPTLAGEELKFLKIVAARSIRYADVIKEKADLGKNLVEYPQTRLGEQLSIIAGLINGGLQTPVYLTKLGGFDTHSRQMTRHEVLLDELATAMGAFQKDLELSSMDEKVVVLTISEFGRRLKENGSAGTDHGSAAPMFLIGKNVNGGKFGNSPNLKNLDRRGDVKYSTDFRQVYASVLSQHFQSENAAVQAALNGDFATLPLIGRGTTSVGDTRAPATFSLNQNYPNPFNASTTIPYSIAKRGRVKLTIYDVNGRQVFKLVDRNHSPGEYQAQLDAARFPSGLYFYKLTTGQFTQQKQMILIK